MEIPKELDYMVEWYKELHGSYSVTQRTGGLIRRGGGGKTKLSFGRVGYFRKRLISENQASMLLEDVVKHDLIIIKIKGEQEYDRLDQFFDNVRTRPDVGYDIINAEQPQPSMPVEKQVLLKIGASQIPKGYAIHFDELVKRERNINLVELFLPERINELKYLN